MQGADDDHERIALVEERLHVTKQAVDTHRVRVTTTVEEHDTVIEETVERGTLSVERVAVERPVTEAPAPRQDGDTLIVAIVEERLVVEKRLFVVEELRITRSSSTERVSLPATVRVMRASVDHDAPVGIGGTDVAPVAPGRN